MKLGNIPPFSVMRLHIVPLSNQPDMYIWMVKGDALNGELFTAPQGQYNRHHHPSLASFPCPNVLDISNIPPSLNIAGIPYALHSIELPPNTESGSGDFLYDSSLFGYG